MDALARVRQFVDDIVVPRRGPLPGVPKDFRVDPADESEWTEWLALPSPVTDEQLDEIESEFEISMPSVLREYFLHVQILDGDFGLMRMPDMKPNAALSGLHQQISVINSHVRLRHYGLLPFGQDGNDGGPLCFQCDGDTRVSDAPIIFFDHERLNDKSYEGDRWWDSFVEMLDAVTEDRLSYEDSDVG